MAVSKGTQLGPYQVVALIGAGGMGEVYRARDPRLHREVAIKILPESFSSDPVRLQRFEQEAHAAAALNHPNILAVYDIGEQNGLHYMVSELLHGQTLSEVLRGGPVPLRKAVDYAIQLAYALAAAHDKAIVHRDLKPDNIFVTTEGRVKILDFGLARLDAPATADEDTLSLQLKTTPGVVMGTVGYLSPEQVRGHAADARSDIFALGVVLYETITGHRAFRKPTPAETMSAVLNEEPAPILQLCPAVPPGIQRVVNRCLMKNLEQRFQHASDLAFALEAISDSDTSSVAIPESAVRARWRWVLFAIAVIAVLAAVGIWLNIPPAVPAVESIKQLTDDGEEKLGTGLIPGLLATDGTRIYFNEGPTGNTHIAQVSVNGGRTALLDDRHANSWLLGISPDHSSLLSMFDTAGIHSVPLWSVPVPAGEPRRLGEKEVSEAAYFPDGRLLLIDGPNVFIAENDGSSPRRLATLDRAAWFPTISPDGKRIVVNTDPFGKGVLIELEADGSAPPRKLGEGMALPAWTSDGKYLIYGSPYLENSQLWALPMRNGARGWFRRSNQPVSLTTGALLFVGAHPSPDGKQIFTLGIKLRSELVRFDLKTRRFVSFLTDLSGNSPTFSADDKWIAYTSYPDHTLWRSRADGSDRMQLTFPPVEVAFPNISYDGTKVAFADNAGAVYIVSMQGGPPQEIVEHACDSGLWSPDGNQLVLGCRTKNMDLQRLYDTRTGKFSDLPGSEGKVGGAWVTDNLILAADQNNTEFTLFDLKTQKWSHLLSGNFVNWAVTRDAKYLVLTTGGADPELKRLRFSDRQVETLTSLKNLRRVVDPIEGQTQVNVDADGSPILARDIGTQEIYALSIKWP